MFLLRTGLWWEPCKTKPMREQNMKALGRERNKRDINCKPLIGVMNLQACKPLLLWYEIKLTETSFGGLWISHRKITSLFSSFFFLIFCFPFRICRKGWWWMAIGLKWTNGFYMWEGRLVGPSKCGHGLIVDRPLQPHVSLWAVPFATALKKTKEDAM